MLPVRIRSSWCQQAPAAAAPPVHPTLVTTPSRCSPMYIAGLAAGLLLSSEAVATALPQALSQSFNGPGTSWAACRPNTSCVSTNSFMSPAQYLPPWSFAPTQQETAFRNLLGQLEELHATVLSTDTAGTDGEFYVLAQLPSNGSSSNYDIVQIKLRPDGVALFKSEAARNTPDPPFCLTRGCISGPANRQRMERLRDALGWAVLETDEDKQLLTENSYVQFGGRYYKQTRGIPMGINPAVYMANFYLFYYERQFLLRLANLFERCCLGAGCRPSPNPADWHPSDVVADLLAQPAAGDVLLPEPSGPDAAHEWGVVE